MAFVVRDSSATIVRPRKLREKNIAGVASADYVLEVRTSSTIGKTCAPWRDWQQLLLDSSEV